MDMTGEDLEKARAVAPKMNEASLHMFVASGLFDLLYRNDDGPQYPVHHKGVHADVTGFYQRNERKARR